MNKYILCCDWGTTSFRLRLVEKNTYQVIDELLSPIGVAVTFREWREQSAISRFDFYAGKLRDSITLLEEKHGNPLDCIPIIVSGMASSSLGMEEIPYATLPFDVNGSQASVRIFKDFNGARSPLIIVSGVRSHEDVMRGEEAQLIGLLKLNEISVQGSEELVFVFPGTHSKHIIIKDNFVMDFRTYMTGEVFNILTEHSILKDSVAPPSAAGLKTPEDINAFLKGIKVSGSSTLLHSLFTVRTSQLFGEFTKEQNSTYLSGLLIGSELRELDNSKYDRIIICSGKHLFDHYKLAAETISISSKTTFISPDMIDKATIAGQLQIFNAFQSISNE